AFLPASVPRTLLMFNVHGEENWLMNLSGRPAFDPITGALFLMGLALAVAKVTRGTTARTPRPPLPGLGEGVPGSGMVSSPATPVAEGAPDHDSPSPRIGRGGRGVR